MEKWKLALIGCGRAGMIHARNFASAIPETCIGAVADASPEAAQKAALELDAPFWTTDYREVLAREDIRAVVIATPTALHREIAVAAAEAGKHVFCEKPMAMNAAECREMMEAAEKRRVTLQIGFMRRFDAGFLRAKEYVDSGAIGDVVLVKSHTRGPSTPHEWMYDIRRSNGPLAEVNSHDIDTLRWFTGSEAQSLYAVAGNYRCPQAREPWPDFYDTVLLSVTMENGAIGCIEGAQGVQYGYDARVDILGTQGCIQIGGLQDKDVLLYTKPGGMRGDVVGSWTGLFAQAYLREDESFAEAVRTGRAPQVTGTDGMMAVRMVCAGNQSITGGGIVRFSDISQ